MNNWRAQNPNIKIVASIGGYTEGVEFYFKGFNFRDFVKIN